MRNLFLILSIVLCATACTKDYSEYDSLSMLTDCERIETSTEHLVYKCPANTPWIQSVKQVEANSAFKLVGNLNLTELYKDSEHTYIEIAFKDNDRCRESFSIRTMISNPDEGAPWAYVGCK